MRAVMLSVLLLLAAPLALAGDAGAGAKKSLPCQACHGDNGNKSIDDATPKLGGQYESYLLQALRDYKSGKRKNLIMSGQVANLSDVDLQDLAAYFARQPREIDDLAGRK
ncbi:MAG: cytochrome c [Xanthomonadales bacterium]|jgi:cytochrome c553|nr:cytochrome c [Xanthomonadales bacterium]